MGCSDPPSEGTLLASTDGVLRAHQCSPGAAACYLLFMLTRAILMTSSHLKAPITRIRYSPDGKYFASACKAGLLKLWDSRSNRVSNTFQKEFDSTPISALGRSKNSP